ncbi:MAG TPA: bacteriohopanetetrol glucosamine biosynthesis glycosyltransferase HpnI [Xanthobacteraceae bacterium]|jgi:ceramide glucosyltransferase
MLLLWSSVTTSVIAIVGCGYLVAAAILVRRFARDRDRADPAGTPDVSILKPLYGNEPGLMENLASFCSQDYPGRVQTIFGVQNPRDDAVAVVERLRQAQAARDVDLVVETKVHGLNRKVSNLVNMAPAIRHDVIIVADSDMRVGPDYLSRVIAALQRPGVGAVTCLYYGMPVTGIWACFSALGINAHFLPSVVVGLALGRARPCFGSTVALRRKTLGEIGGFMAFVDCLADDYAIGAALRARGRTIAIPPFAIAHICAQTSLRELWQHELRWARTIRSIDPAGYAGSIVAHPLPWALIAVLLGAASAALLPAIGIAMAAIACRMALLRQVEQAYALPSQVYWLVPARDLLSFAVLVSSFLGWDVSWKGHRYRMVAGRRWLADRGSHAP